MAISCALAQGCAEVIVGAGDAAHVDATKEPDVFDVRDVPTEEVTDATVGVDVDDRPTGIDVRDPGDVPDWRDLPTYENRVGEECHEVPWATLLPTNIPLVGTLTRPLRRDVVPDGEYVLRQIDRIQEVSPHDTLPTHLALRIRVDETHWQIARLTYDGQAVASQRASCELQPPTLVDRRACRYTCPETWLRVDTLQYLFGAFSDYEMRGSQLVLLVLPYFLFTFEPVSAP